MKAFVKNIKSIWNSCGKTAAQCAKVTRHGFAVYKQGWEEAEAFWQENPEARSDFYFNTFMI